ncbi:hypothetical protein NHQ30_002590 [Ciborinia camelliae]|nr:hypothetical protein NHQ30_002590 [Ciborinia camelliae]
MAPELKYYDFHDYSNMITILVGPPDKYLRQTSVLAPVGLLSTQSGFFKAACKVDWKTGRENQIDLKHVKKEPFEIFMAWLNCGDIKKAKSWNEVNPRDVPSKRLEDHAIQWSNLCQSYILAEFLIAPRFANAVIGVMLACLKQFEKEEQSESISPLCNTGIDTIKDVWSNTPVNSPIRRLFMDYLASSRHADAEKISKNFGKIDGSVKSELLVPVEFILDFVKHQGFYLKTGNSIRRCDFWKECYYHIHEDGESCTK